VKSNGLASGDGRDGSDRTSNLCHRRKVRALWSYHALALSILHRDI